MDTCVAVFPSGARWIRIDVDSAPRRTHVLLQLRVVRDALRVPDISIRPVSCATFSNQIIDFYSSTHILRND